MKKKILILIIVGLLCTGCDGNITRDIRKSGYSISNQKFICATILPEKKLFGNESTTQVEKIKFLNNNLIISENGNLYEVTFNGLYSNNMSCKKVGSEIKAISVIDNEVVKGENNKYYYLGSTKENTISYEEVSKEDPKLELYKLILEDNKVTKAMNVNSNTNSYYVLKENGNIYNYVIKQNEETKKYEVLTDNIVYHSSDFDGKIIDFKYYGENNSTYFKTSKSIYRMKNTNMEKCSKYVDIECKYELKKDEKITKNKDRIIGYGGNTIITDYGKIFTVGS